MQEGDRDDEEASAQQGGVQEEAMGLRLVPVNAGAAGDHAEQQQVDGSKCRQSAGPVREQEQQHPQGSERV